MTHVTDDTREDEIPFWMSIPTSCLETLKTGIAAHVDRLNEKHGRHRAPEFPLFQGKAEPLPRRPVGYRLLIGPADSVGIYP